MSKGKLKHFLFNIKNISSSANIMSSSNKKKLSNDDYCLDCKLDLGNYKKNLKIIVLLSGYPYAFWSEDEEKYTGLAVDIMNRLIKDLDLKPLITWQEKKDVNFGKAIKDVASGQYDMAVGNFSIMEEDEKIVNFTHPIYLTTGSLLHSPEINYWSFLKNTLKKLVKPILILFTIAVALGLISFYVKGRYGDKKAKFRWHLWGTLSALLGEPGTIVEDSHMDHKVSLLLGIVILSVSFYLGIYLTAHTTSAAITYSSKYDPFAEYGIKDRNIIVNKGSSYVDEVKRFGANPIIKERKDSGVELLLKDYKNADGYFDDEGYILSELDERPDIQVNYSAWPKTHIGITPIAIVVNKNLTGLLRSVNIQILKLYEKGFMVFQCDRWLGGRSDKNLCKF